MGFNKLNAEEKVLFRFGSFQIASLTQGKSVLKKETVTVCLTSHYVCFKCGDSPSPFCVECLARALLSPASCSCYGHQHSTREMLTKATFKSKEVQVASIVLGEGTKPGGGAWFSLKLLYLVAASAEF